MNTFYRRLCGALNLILAFGFLSSCAAAPKEYSRSAFVLGTSCSVRLVGGGSEKLLDEVFARLAAIENELSVNKEGSQIDAVNAKAGLEPVVVGPDALAILKRDMNLSTWSNGAFDPSVGPLVKLWGIGTDHERLPSASEVAQARSLVSWKDIVLDESKSSVFLRRKGMALDLGSTSKGFAADDVAAIIRKAGVKKAVIDLGGNVLVVGSRPDGAPWRVGLQNPFSGERGDYIGIAKLVDETMVTSGVYERYFIKDGVRYHHILDTATGYPVNNGLMSVTIITPKSFDADGFTTTIFALGREKGMALAREQGVGVIVVDRDKKVYCSPGVSSYFELTDKSFSLAE
jgi:Membrane-associated lipoprotein involved in thiamine biosynthesis